MLIMAHLTLHSKMSASRWVITISWLKLNKNLGIHSQASLSLYFTLMTNKKVKVHFHQVLKVFSQKILTARMLFRSHQPQLMALPRKTKKDLRCVFQCYLFYIFPCVFIIRPFYWSFLDSWDTSSSTICCCSVAHWCPSFWKFMNCSTPGLPALHHFLEFAQTHVHWVNYAVQPFHPQLSPAVYSEVEIISTFRPDQVHLASIFHLLIRWECQVHQNVDLNSGPASNQLITSLLLHPSNKKSLTPQPPYAPWLWLWIKNDQLLNFFLFFYQTHSMTGYIVSLEIERFVDIIVVSWTNHSTVLHERKPSSWSPCGPIPTTPNIPTNIFLNWFIKPQME